MDPQSPVNFPRRSKGSRPASDFVICGLSPRMEEDPETGWHKRILFFGSTSFLDELCIHAGLLSGHVTPHPPHCHEHEELQIALADGIEFVEYDTVSGLEKAQPIARGDLQFTDSNLQHTFRNAGPQPAAYFHARWKNTSCRLHREMTRLKFHFSPIYPDQTARQSIHNGVETTEIFSGPTRILPRLRALFIRLGPGSSISLHRHAHEVIFALVASSVEILGRRVDAPGFAFIGAFVPHCIANRGPGTAELYAFELHPEV